MRQSLPFYLVLAGALLYLSKGSETSRRSANLFLLIGIVLYFVQRQSKQYLIHRIDTDNMNEVLLVECIWNDTPSLFLIDTGYAGPPVLSRSYMTTQDPVVKDIQERYQSVIAQMQSVTEKDEHEAIHGFIQKNECFVFTSGCTMRLMSVGATEVQQADMMMCAPLSLRNTWRGFHAPKNDTQSRADVFVTNSLRSSVHILTCDYLLHHAPSLIDIGQGILRCNLDPLELLTLSTRFHKFPLSFSGGAFVIPISIYGTVFRCTVDTGAPGPICLGKDAVKKLSGCQKLPKNMSVKQQGVNGEQMCSDVIVVEVEFCDESFATPAFVNSLAVEHVDGYVGLGFLRAYDILLSHGGIGFRKNGIPRRPVEYFSFGSKEERCNPDLRCSR